MHHAVFSAILKYMGLDDRARGLMMDYLTGRRQMVQVGDSRSEFRDVVCGCPQGSVLSPLMYTLYTSSFKDKIKHCKSHFYADDTQIYLSFNPFDVDAGCKKVNEDLKALVDFSRLHNLEINPSKTEVILFGPPKAKNMVREMVRLAIDGSPLTISSTVKNLGVLIDENLTFNDHINKCAQKAYGALRLIYTNRTYLSHGTKRLLCDSLVLSYFNYADVLYSPFLSYQLKYKIQKVQNACLRTIYGIRRRDHVSHKLGEALWLNMGNRRLLHAACHFHRIIITGKPPYLKSRIRFRSDVHTLNIRFRGTLTPPIHRTELFKKSFSYYITKVYNAIGESLRACASVSAFGGKYRIQLFETQ